MVITSFTAREGQGSVILTWTITAGCEGETGTLSRQFAGTMYPGYWQFPIRATSRTYTDHPAKPAGSQECSFSLSYWLHMSGTAPDGQGVPATNVQISDVNLC
jgi:hypothetical protein